MKWESKIRNFTLMSLKILEIFYYGRAMCLLTLCYNAINNKTCFENFDFNYICSWAWDRNFQWDSFKHISAQSPVHLRQGCP